MLVNSYFFRCRTSLLSQTYLKSSTMTTAPRPSPGRSPSCRRMPPRVYEQVQPLLLSFINVIPSYNGPAWLKLLMILGLCPRHYTRLPFRSRVYILLSLKSSVKRLHSYRGNPISSPKPDPASCQSFWQRHLRRGLRPGRWRCRLNL